MAGGDSHQRAKERAAKNRIDKKISRAVSDHLSFKMPPAEQTKPPEKPPWYESGLFWGCLSLAAAIVLTVIAAMLKDFRWLLFLVWPLMGICFLLLCRALNKSLRKWSWVLFATLCIGAAGGLWKVYATLEPPEPLYCYGFFVRSDSSNEYRWLFEVANLGPGSATNVDVNVWDVTTLTDRGVFDRSKIRNVLVPVVYPLFVSRYTPLRATWTSISYSPGEMGSIYQIILAPENGDQVTETLIFKKDMRECLTIRRDRDDKVLVKNMSPHFDTYGGGMTAVPCKP